MKINVHSVCDAIIHYSLYLTVFLTPIFFLPLTPYPATLNKQFIFTTLILVATGAWLVKATRTGKIEYTKSITGIPLVALVLFAFTSAFFSGARTMSFMGVMGGEVDTTLAIISFTLLYFLLPLVFKDKDDVKKMLMVLMASASLVVLATVPAMVSALTGFFGYPLPVWDFVNANTVGTTNAFGLYVGCIALLAFGIFQYIPVPKYVRIWSGIVASISFALVVLIGYWAIFIALLCGLSVLAWLDARSDGQKHARGKSLPLALIVVCAAMVFLGTNIITISLPRIPAPPEVAPSIRASLGVARKTAGEGVQHFLLGSGPATYAYQYARYRDVHLNATPFWSVRFTQGFNALLTHLVSWGIFGTLLFVLFLIASAYAVFRMARNRRAERMVLLITAFAVYMGIYVFVYPQNFVLYFLLFIAMGLVAMHSAREKGAQASIAVWRIVPMFALLAVVVVGYTHTKRYVGAIRFAQGIARAAETKDVTQSLPALIAGVRLDSNNDVYLQALASAYLAQANVIAIKAGEKADESVKKQVADAIASAVAAAERATQVNSLNAENWVGLAQVYDAIAPFNESAALSASAVYAKARSLDPANPIIPTYLGASYRATAGRMKSGNVEQYAAARAAYEEAIALKQDYAPAYFGLIGMFDDVGKSADAEARAERLRSFVSGNAEVLFQIGFAHYQAGRTEKAREVLEQTLTIVPNYANALYFLGLIYEKEGNTARAITQFERVLALNPTSAEVKEMIANLRAKK